MNTRNIVVVRKLTYDTDFKSTVIDGVFTALIEDFPKSGKIVDVMTTPVDIHIAIEAELTDTGVLLTEETDIIMVKGEAKFSKTPEFDEWISDRNAAIKKQGDTPIVLKPQINEYECIRYDFIYKNAFYLHTYKFSPLNVTL